MSVLDNLEKEYKLRMGNYCTPIRLTETIIQLDMIFKVLVEILRELQVKNTKWKRK